MATPPPGIRSSLRDLRRLALLLRSEWPALGRAGALSIVSGGLGLTVPFFAAVLFDRVYPSGNLSLLGLAVIGLIAAKAAEGVIYNLFRFNAFIVQARMRDVAGLALFNHVLHLPSRVLESRRSGEIANRFGDVQQVVNTGADAALTVMSKCVYLFAIPPILFLIDPRLALVALIAVPLTATITAILGAWANRQWVSTYEAYDQWAAFRIEAIREARTFKTMGCEAALYRRAQTHVIQAHRGTVTATGIWYVCNGINAVIQAVHLGTLTYVGWRLVIADNLTLGGYVAFQAYSSLLLAPLSALIEAGGKLQKASVSLSRVFDLADESPEANPAEALSRAERPFGERDVPSVEYTGRIRLRDVRFHYGPSAPGLDLPQLDLEPGKAVALVGPSGCGKTTVLRLLGQAERPHAGRIEVETTGALGGDGGPRWIQIGKAEQWRDRVAVCWQQPGMLSLSIRDNLLIAAEDVAGRPIDNAEMRAVLDDCELGDRVAELARQSSSDDPLAVVLSEGGASVSAGERQRLALARLLLRVRVAAAPVRLVLLDEAAASLDAPTARTVLSRILAELRSHRSPPAILLVTHRTGHAELTDRTVHLSARPSDEVSPSA